MIETHDHKRLHELRREMHALKHAIRKIETRKQPRCRVRESRFVLAATAARTAFRSSGVHVFVDDFADVGKHGVGLSVAVDFDDIGFRESKCSGSRFRDDSPSGPVQSARGAVP
jgi:hypothetical protein